jgi:splicing factor U2AF subunit
VFVLETVVEGLRLAAGPQSTPNQTVGLEQVHNIISSSLMARHLARIHGTEEDKINCPFYFKIGACRHSDRCSRIHHRPAFSPTILIKHVYRHPIREAELQAAREGRSVDDVGDIDEEKARDDFLIFFE